MQFVTALRELTLKISNFGLRFIPFWVNMYHLMSKSGILVLLERHVDPFGQGYQIWPLNVAPNGTNLSLFMIGFLFILAHLFKGKNIRKLI